jgi:hypothetical protein
MCLPSSNWAQLRADGLLLEQGLLSCDLLGPNIYIAIGTAALHAPPESSIEEKNILFIFFTIILLAVTADGLHEFYMGVFGSLLHQAWLAKTNQVNSSLAPPVQDVVWFTFLFLS